MKSTLKKSSSEEAWENRKLGASAKHTRKISAAREKNIDEGLGLFMISIRLQKKMIQDLKQLAKESGLGYQPYIRQVLAHHVRTKKKMNEGRH